MADQGQHRKSVTVRWVVRNDGTYSNYPTPTEYVLKKRGPIEVGGGDVTEYKIVTGPFTRGEEALINTNVFTSPELIPLATLHSPSHGYILDDTLQFTIQFERVAEDGSGRSSSTRPRTGQTQTLNPALNLVPHP